MDAPNGQATLFSLFSQQEDVSVRGFSLKTTADSFVVPDCTSKLKSLRSAKKLETFKSQLKQELVVEKEKVVCAASTTTLPCTLQPSFDKDSNARSEEEKGQQSERVAITRGYVAANETWWREHLFSLTFPLVQSTSATQGEHQRKGSSSDCLSQLGGTAIIFAHLSLSL